MNTFLSLLLITLAFVLGSGSIHASPNSDGAEYVTFRDGENTWRYLKYSNHGWTVYIEESLVERKALLADLDAELDKSFAHIEKVIPETPLAFLKTIPVWVSNEPTYPLRRGEQGVIPFHRSGQWLREHGLNPHMASGVHVINPGAVLYVHKIFEWGPMTILHELSHAYHNLYLGSDHPLIARAYYNAMATKLYRRVPDRSNPNRKVMAYAVTNQQEYFAELTEAYFGRNDWFPHSSSQLRDYDPVGFNMIEQTWGRRQ